MSDSLENIIDTPIAHDVERQLAVSAVITALESYASDNGNYSVSGFGAGGNGQGWFHRQAGNYPQSIYSALIEYLTDVPSDPLHLDTSSPSSNDFLVYRCEDRIAVFSLSDGIQPSSQDLDWWESNGCTTLPTARFNHTYFEVSDSLENVIDTPVTHDAERQLAVSAVITALESYAADNGNYTVSGFGAGGNGQGLSLIHI